MPWAAAAAVGSAVIGSAATRSAANKQSDAAAAAAAEQGRQFDISREDKRLEREVGVGALQELAGFRNTEMPTAAEVMAEPGYQFGLKQGSDAIQGTAAARGGLYSGKALRDLTRFGTDYATTKFGDAFNRREAAIGNRWGRLSSLAGISQAATNQAQQAGQNYANQVGQIGLGNANAQGAAGIANANIWGNAVNQVGSIGSRNNWWQQQPQQGYGQYAPQGNSGVPTDNGSYSDYGYMGGP